MRCVWRHVFNIRHIRARVRKGNDVKYDNAYGRNQISRVQRTSACCLLFSESYTLRPGEHDNGLGTVSTVVIVTIAADFAGFFGPSVKIIFTTIITTTIWPPYDIKEGPPHTIIEQISFQVTLHRFTNVIYYFSKSI